MSDRTPSPFIIKLEPGQTEIDLRPLLEPLIRQVMYMASADSSSNRLQNSVETLDAFIAGAIEHHEIMSAVERIPCEAIAHYMKSTGWRNSGQNYTGRVQYYPPDSYRQGGGVCVMLREQYAENDPGQLDRNYKAIRQIAGAERTWMTEPIDGARLRATIDKIFKSYDAVSALGKLADG